jgi:hypothetical protein
MVTYRPRLTDDEVFQIRLALDGAVLRNIDLIEGALAEPEAQMYAAQVGQFAALYIKIRALAGYHAAGAQRAGQWTRRADSELERWKRAHKR